MIHRILHKHIQGDENYIVGFANLSGLVFNTENHYGIVIGRKLHDNIVDQISEGPTFDYYHHNNTLNTELQTLIQNIANDIQKEGYQCEVVEPTVKESEVKDPNYSQTLRTPVSHKMIGTRSGLGWIGKTDLFVSRQFGPRLRMVSLLTNYPVESEHPPIDKSRCGTCNICVEKCPGKASSGLLWDIYTDRDRFFDAHKCRNTCRELAKKHLNEDLSVCGICVAVCPIGKREIPG
jgi:Uncharacterized Fe-S protein